MISLRVPRILKLLAILFIVADGLIHLIDAPQHYTAAPVIGVLFVADFLGSLVSAFGIYRDALWGWLLGVLIAGGAFVAYSYIATRSIGLPGFEQAIGKSGPLGVISLVLEVLFVALFVLALIVWRRDES
jgi:hypothetical protein